MSIHFANYPNLNNYVLLAGGTITSVTRTTISPNPPYNAYYGTPTSSIVGQATIEGGTLNNTDATAAQSDLASLVTALTNAVNASSTPFPDITGSNYILTPGNYTIPSLALTSGQSIQFNGQGQYIIYVQSGDITLTSVDFILYPNSVSRTEIYWYSPNGITIFQSPYNEPGSGVPGIFIASGKSPSTSVITATDSSFFGNLYSLGAVSTTDVTINPVTICFLKGTKILTENGPKLVEDLSVGENIITYGQIVNNSDVVISKTVQAKPITWIGKFISIKHDSNDIPICFKAGSLGENIPLNDLYVSPGHRIIIDGKFVIARDAVNGKTIVQEDTVETIEYYHFELDYHSIIEAEGVLTETYFEIDEYSKSKFQRGLKL